MASQPRYTQQTSFTSSDATNDTVAGLLTRLVNDVTGLLRNEFALARVELSNAATDAKRGLGSIAASGAVMFGGYLALLAAAIFGLSYVMQPWLASLIVGAAAIIVGMIMLKAGQKKVSPSAFRMERTQESLRKDAGTVRRSV